MDPVSEGAKMGTKSKTGAQRGFSLLETIFAILVLSIGVLSLAGILAAGLAYMSSSQDDFLAQQKAGEAVESIFTARDSGALNWAAIDNISNGGIFTNGPAQLCDPGPDGIVGTIDDNCALPDCIETPGPDGILGTADDVCMPLQTFTRTIAITTNVGGDTTLKQVTVTMNYNVGQLTRQYVLNTYVSQSF
jgi:prepilin-type N-terminal cleavage/methylation domain-containing protein